MNTLSNTHHAPARKQRIAVVTMGVKLGDETRGYTRFRFLSELLVREGFDVTLFTSSFQHWEKAQRDVEKACYRRPSVSRRLHSRAWLQEEPRPRAHHEPP